MSLVALETPKDPDFPGVKCIVGEWIDDESY